MTKSMIQPIQTHNHHAKTTLRSVVTPEEEVSNDRIHFLLARMKANRRNKYTVPGACDDGDDDETNFSVSSNNGPPETPSLPKCMAFDLSPPPRRPINTSWERDGNFPSVLPLGDRECATGETKSSDSKIVLSDALGGNKTCGKRKFRPSTGGGRGFFFPPQFTDTSEGISENKPIYPKMGKGDVLRPSIPFVPFRFEHIPHNEENMLKTPKARARRVDYLLSKALETVSHTDLVENGPTKLSSDREKQRKTCSAQCA